jgi:hypothetical protein
MSVELAPTLWWPEAALRFHPELTSERDTHPLRGLQRFGPYSKALLLPSPIRIATIAPHGESTRLFSFMKELQQAARPRERPDYLPEWPGFSQVFQTKLTGTARRSHLELAAALDDQLAETDKPELWLAEALTRAIGELGAFRSDFDILFLYLPARWEAAFFGDDDFDLHDHLKALTAARGIPLQIVREDSALAYKCRASVMWRVGLAIYAKAGGVPWKLADADPETAYIGISYAVRPKETDKPRFVTCCSQVFDADGSGLEFVAYDTRDAEVHRENPFLSQTEMFRVINRSMDLYRGRHAGRSPRRVMIHKSTEFKNDEIKGCFEALPLCESVDLIQVVEDVSWRGIHMDEDKRKPGHGVAARYPVRRGSLISLTDREALFWLHGRVDGLSDKPHFQGGRSTPQPLRFVRHAGHGGWDDTARSALALSKMNWNNDALYDHLPVTMSYAKVLARVVKRMPALGTAPYQFRFFM